MSWRRNEIEITSTVDLADYDDEIMEYVQPDDISDAMELMDKWGYSDGDILDYMLEDMDNDYFLSKLSDILTVESALELVKNVYEYGKSIQVRTLTNTQNQLHELREKIRQLENKDDTQNV
tara:strand:- start:51 stop:413 length:363 start_codon:yes stop_codon:yes gene_type:complete